MVDMKTELNIKVNDNSVLKDAIVIEGFDNKYIRVEDSNDNTYYLKWDGYMYRGKFLDFDITCQYKVAKNFSSIKVSEPGSEKFTRKKSGYPKN